MIEDVLEEIFLHLSIPVDVVRVSNVCQLWRNILSPENTGFWVEYERRHPNTMQEIKRSKTQAKKMSVIESIHLHLNKACWRCHSGRPRTFYDFERPKRLCESCLHCVTINEYYLTYIDIDKTTIPCNNGTTYCPSSHSTYESRWYYLPTVCSRIKEVYNRDFDPEAHDVKKQIQDFSVERYQISIEEEKERYQIYIEEKKEEDAKKKRKMFEEMLRQKYPLLSLDEAVTEEKKQKRAMTSKKMAITRFINKSSRDQLEKITNLPTSITISDPTIYIKSLPRHDQTEMPKMEWINERLFSNLQQDITNARLLLEKTKEQFIYNLNKINTRYDDDPETCLRSFNVENFTAVIEKHDKSAKILCPCGKELGADHHQFETHVEEFRRIQNRNHPPPPHFHRKRKNTFDTISSKRNKVSEPNARVIKIQQIRLSLKSELNAMAYPLYCQLREKAESIISKSFSKFFQMEVAMLIALFVVSETRTSVSIPYLDDLEVNEMKRMCQEFQIDFQINDTDFDVLKSCIMRKF